MTSTPDLRPLGGCDDPASVLGYARGRDRDGDQADRDVMVAAAKFASMHTEDSLVGPVETWHESCLPLGGSGCPGVAEFAVHEFAAALGKSPESGRRFLGQAVEAFYRLPDCWQQLRAGRVQAWRLGMIADATMCLSRDAAGFVDTHVAPVAHQVGPAQLMRLVQEAKARFDPEATEAERAAAADARHFDVELAQVSCAGTVHVEGDLDLADAYDLNTAVSAGASELAALGSTESLDVRRSVALGEMARAQLAFGFQTAEGTGPENSPEGTPKRPVPGRQIVLHTHLSADAVTGATGAGTGTGGADLARVQQVLAAITAEQVRRWCGNPNTTVTVKPVLDLAEHIWVMSYEASDRLKNQTVLRDGTCAHPWCTRAAVRCDCEHRVPHDPEHPGRGPTCSCNLAPSCRPHHRAKTTGGWTYVTLEPGTYLWRSPLGYQYLRDHTGTLDVTPDNDRRRYARELIAHFGGPWGDQPPDE